MGKRGWIRTDEELSSFVEETDEILNKGTYQNLMFQLNKLARHSKGAGITTQRQYYHHMDLFIRFLADEFGVQRLANFSGKHVAAYVEYRQSEGVSAATVKNDLAAIRYYHDQLSDPRHRLPDNKYLCKTYGISLERRSFGGVNRRWTWSEVHHMVELAMRKERHDVSAMIRIGAGLGLRIHEVVRLSRGDVEGALRSGTLIVKGKGGLIRAVPLTDEMSALLRNIIVSVPRGHKVFVPTERKAHEVIQSVKSFIHHHRERVEESGARPDGVHLTFHGLRHLFAYDRYQEFLKSGLSPAAARLKVAELLGHFRDDVTRIYLAEGEDTNGRDRKAAETNPGDGETN